MPATDPIAILTQGVVRQLLWLLALVLALPALKVLLVPMLRGRAGEARVGAVLDRIGADTLHDVILPDGRGGSTQVDHLVLTGAGILVVETKNYSGLVFGQEREAQWTQRLGRRSFRFQSPLRQNYSHLQAVRALAPGVPVLGRVVFTDNARFPQGAPEGVSILADLRRDLANLIGDAAPSPDLRLGWATLKTRADKSPEGRKAHLEGLRERHGPDRVRPVALGLLATAGVLAAGLWLWPAPEGQVPHRVQPTAAAPGPAPAPWVPLPKVAPTVVPSPVSPDPAVPAVALAWADTNQSEQEGAKAACHSAIAAVLIDNSPENRKLRDRACGTGANRRDGPR
jgi:hypothetical protein